MYIGNLTPQKLAKITEIAIREQVEKNRLTEEEYNSYYKEFLILAYQNAKKGYNFVGRNYELAKLFNHNLQKECEFVLRLKNIGYTVNEHTVKWNE